MDSDQGFGVFSHFPVAACSGKRVIRPAGSVEPAETRLREIFPVGRKPFEFNSIFPGVLFPERIHAFGASHKELLAKLEQQFADRLEELKVQQDKQYDNLRTTISDLALQQRYSNGGFYERNSYQLPNIESEEVPADNRDLRVSPDKTLEMENF